MVTLKQMPALRLASVTLAVCAYVFITDHFIGLSQEPSIPSATQREVQVILTVTDPYGRYMGGLGKEKLTVLDNDVPRDIVRVEWSNKPVSVGLLFNVSKAKHAELLKYTRRALLNFYESKEGKQGVNDYFIMGFDNGEFLATDWTTEADNLANGFDKLASIKPSKNATAYDTLEAGLRKIDTGTHFKRAMIMISDVGETGRGSKRDILMEALRRSNVLLYVIDVERNTVLAPDTFQRPDLGPMCAISGGFARVVRSVPEFEDLLEIIALELNHQYLVGFTPKGNSSTQREWHRLKFDVKPLVAKPPSAEKYKKIELSVRGREGYYYP